MKFPVHSILLSLMQKVLGESPSSGQQACALLNTDQFVGYSGFVVHQEVQIRPKGGLNSSQPSIEPTALASTDNTIITQCAHGDPVATIPVTGALWNQTYCSQDGETVCVRLARRRVGLIERSYNDNKSGQEDPSATSPALETNESTDDEEEEVEFTDISGSEEGTDDGAVEQEGDVEWNDADGLATPPDSNNMENAEENLTDLDVQSADEPEPKQPESKNNNPPTVVGVKEGNLLQRRRQGSDAADPIALGINYDDGPEVETADLPLNNPGDSSGTNGAVGDTRDTAGYQFSRLGNGMGDRLGDRLGNSTGAGSSRRIARASARLSSVYGAVFQCRDGEQPEQCQAVVPLARVSAPELISRKLWWAVESGQTLTSQQQQQNQKWSSSWPTLRLHRVIMYSPDQLDRRYPHHDRWTQLLSPVELY